MIEMQIQRRHLLVAGAGIATPSLRVFGQVRPSMRRIGFLSTASVTGTATYLAAFRAAMTDLRWLEGRDYVIDARYANGVAQATSGLAAALVATNPDLLLTTGELAIRSLAEKTKTIPIVFTAAQDPVANGLAASLRRPGGNVTGLTTLATELAAKRLQLLKEAFPSVVHVALLFEPDNAGSASQVKEIEAVAPRLGVRTTAIEMRKPEDVEAAFKRGAALGAHAYMVGQGGIAISQRQEIVDRVNRLKVPAQLPDDQFVEKGGLMSYSASVENNYRLAAGYVDKIFKGSKPGELPIQQPTKFELVVNLKTAKAMGLTFPQYFLVRADRVIE